MADCGTEPTGALDGIRVLDLTVARAGPTCARQLADLGAEVIRVSRPGHRDLGGSDAENLRRDRREVVLDLTTGDGLDAFHRLAANADVLVENFRAPVKGRLGIGPDVVRARHPRLVYASISGFGQHGPYADRPAVDQIAQGMSGIMSVTGPPGTGPWRVGLAISDTAAGTLLTQGVLAALLARERTGEGQWVHTSLLEAAVYFMDFQLARYLNEGEVPGQTGNDHPSLPAMGTFATSDGYLNIAATWRWDAFVDAIGADSIAADPRFADAAGRAEHRGELDRHLRDHLARRRTDEWLAPLVDAGIPAGPVLDARGVFDDPQVAVLQPAVTLDGARGPVRVLRHPVTLEGTPTRVRRAMVPPGTDTRAVLAELGYTDVQIDAMLAAGAAALAPPDGAEPPPWGRE